MEPTMITSAARRPFGAVVALLTALLLVAATLAAITSTEAAADGSTGSYTNPVGEEQLPNFADPTVIRGRDGYWYAYSTADPLFAGDRYRKMKIGRSADLVSWEYVGEVFTDETEPRYDGFGDDANRMYWAPDIEYFDGRYLLYYSYVVNSGSDRHWRAIGVATAPHPAGPWTDSGAFVTGPETWEPRPGVQAWRNVIDPEVVSTPDGSRYLYYGSVNGGVRVVRLSDDGLSAVGERTQVTLENRYEAAHIVQRDGYYYLFLSVIGGCCAGPVSAYPVQVARARTPLGPFLDRDGLPVLGRHAGGTPVQTPNGNRWVSVGHNSLATDLSGQQWLVTHGLDREQPYLQGTLNARKLAISRLDWVDGWPTANAGRGMLDGPEPAPVTEAKIADAFESGFSGRDWERRPGWTIEEEPAGRFLQVDADAPVQTLYATRRIDGDARIRGTVRLAPEPGGSAGFVLDGTRTRHRVTIDRAANALVVEERRRGAMRIRDTQPLPPRFDHGDWHELDLQIRGRDLRVTVTHAGLDDPLAISSVRLQRPPDRARFALAADGTAASFDDITVASMFTPVTEKVPDPEVGSLLPDESDEFDQDLGSGWDGVRDPQASVVDGSLVLPVEEEKELIDQRPMTDDSAALLLRRPPEGDWTAETKVTVPYGDGYPLDWPQAGFIAHAGDDRFVNLSYAAARRTRHVAFGKEMPWQDRVVYGDARLGPTTSDTVWLRLRHRVDPQTGEHHYRAAVSADGETWVWHGTRVLAAGESPAIGLAAFGAGAGAGLSAEFDYVRFYDR
jgi:arabinan endo-1,5-alpha-L-arabinosidase